MRSRWPWLLPVAILLTVWAWWPMFVAYPNTATLDGRAFHYLIATSKAIVVQHHELPLWNPFDCHGIPLWDHPENITASPIFWLTLGLTTTKTLIVWHVFHTVVGFIGMWLLARLDIKLSPNNALLAAALWAFAAGHTTQYAGAHEALISFYNVPLLFFLWRRAEESSKYAVGTGLALAWMIYDGATYPLPFTILALGLESFLRFSSLLRVRRIVVAGLIVGVVAFTVGASRIVPLVAQLGSHTRSFDGYPDVDHLLAKTVWHMYTTRSASYLARVDGQQYVFGEYLTYIGWLGVALALIGAAASAADLAWLVALSAMLCILMAGHFAKWAPWTLLHEHVFPFKSMRVSARFRLILMMPISLWIALASERLPRLVRPFAPRSAELVGAIFLTLGFLVAGDAAGLGQELIAPRFTGAPEVAVTRSPHFYYGGPGLTPDLIDQPRQNRAYLGCRFTWAFHTDSPLWSGDVPQAKAIDDHAVVESATRTANTFTFDVEVKEPARVLLNSGHDRSWRTSEGTVVEHQGMVAVDLPRPGRYKVHVKYWPQGLTAGFVLTAIGLVLSIAYLIRARRADRPVSSRPG